MSDSRAGALHRHGTRVHRHAYAKRVGRRLLADIEPYLRFFAIARS